MMTQPEFEFEQNRKINNETIGTVQLLNITINIYKGILLYNILLLCTMSIFQVSFFIIYTFKIYVTFVNSYHVKLSILE